MGNLGLDKVQLEAIEFLLSHKSANICLRVGKGKSLIAIGYLLKAKFVNAILICPKSILANWVKQLDAYKLGDRVKVLSMGLVHKHKSSLEFADIVIIDEPKLLKGDTQFAQFMLSLPRHEHQVRILLDATSIENTTDDLDNLCAWLGIAPADMYTYSFPKDQNLNQAVRPTKWHKIRVPIAGQETALIRMLELQLGKCLIPTIKSMRAVQLAIMDLLAALNDVGPYGMGRRKVAAILDIIQERHPKDCGVICSSKLEPMDYICKQLTLAGFKAVTFSGKLSAKQRAKIVDDFNAGLVDWVVTTKAGERGCDLRRGNVIFHYDLPYSGASFIQRDRVTRRSGDLNTVTHNYVIMIADSAEQVVYEKVKAKIAMDEALKEGTLRSFFGLSWKKFLIDKFTRVYKINLIKELGQ